jgi:hypothetical protein
MMPSELPAEGSPRGGGREARDRLRAEVERVVWELAALEEAFRAEWPGLAERVAALRSELMASLSDLAEP